MLHKALSLIARVGTVTYLVYLAWPDARDMWLQAQTGDLSLMGWTYLVAMLITGVSLVLVFCAVALLLVSGLLIAGRNTLKHYLTLILRDAASLHCGR